MRGIGQYILDDSHNPVEASGLKWAMWIESSNDKRRVARDELPGGGMISTVFLGLDHRFGEDGPPILFETMVFGPPLERAGTPDRREPLAQERYSTWAEAEAGHAVLLEKFRDALKAAQS